MKLQDRKIPGTWDLEPGTELNGDGFTYRTGPN